MNLLPWLHSCSSEVQFLETINKTLVLEVQEQGLCPRQPKRAETTLSWLGIHVPMQRDRKTSTQSWLRHDSPESGGVGGAPTEQALEDESQVAHSQGHISWYDLWRQWAAVSNFIYVLFTMCFEFILHSSHLELEWGAGYCSKASGLPRVLFVGSFCPPDQKRTVCTPLSCFKARVTC